MTQKEKDLLLKDLCARLPYGVKISFKEQACIIDTIAQDSSLLIKTNDGYIPSIEEGLFVKIEDCKPYLRPMSSMTEEEKEDYNKLFTTITSKDCNFGKWLAPENDGKLIDFYNSRYIDYRGLIPMGLAIEAPDGMYN